MTPRPRLHSQERGTAAPRPLPGRKKGHLFPFVLLALGAFLLLFVFLPDVHARVGGGQSYGGGGSGGGGGGGSGDGDWIELVYWLIVLNIDYPAIGIPVDLIILAILIGSAISASNRKPSYSSRSTAVVSPPAAEGDRFEILRKYDPNFSEILFTDFIYTLYARVHEARGRNDLATYSPYLDAGVIERLQALSGPRLKEVTGVIVGTSRILAMSNPERPTITISVFFEANYTEASTGDGTAVTSNTWYVREEWGFTRKRDVLSRPPETITALHCPKCGGSLERKPDGSCAHCGVKIVGGNFDWFVTRVVLRQREAKGPLLTRDVAEQGTDLPTVHQPNFPAVRQRFMALNRDFSWPQMEARVRHIFLELQRAWSDLRWERARPYETDNIFQMHRYWITAYQRQQMRNLLKDVRIEQVIPVKVVMDPFHDAVMLRIFAGMIDYTVNAAGNLVSGNRNETRRFSEYWTFIRRRGVKASGRADNQCPNCGAALKVNMAGVCEYCHGKITSGEFDWVLSRIEQDEAYKG